MNHRFSLLGTIVVMMGVATGCGAGDATFEDEDEVRAVIGETLIHEVGHYFGMSEEQIEEIEERYWRGETSPEDED